MHIILKNFSNHEISNIVISIEEPEARSISRGAIGNLKAGESNKVMNTFMMQKIVCPILWRYGSLTTRWLAKE